MSVSIKTTLALAVAAVFVAAAPRVEAQGKTVLRFGDSLPANHFFTETLAKPWMVEVTKTTNGQVEFQHYPAEQLGKAKDMLQLMQSGVVDVALIVPPYISDKLPLSGVAELPGGFATSCAGVRALWKNLNGGTLEQGRAAAQRPARAVRARATTVPDLHDQEENRDDQGHRGPEAPHDRRRDGPDGA